MPGNGAGLGLMAGAVSLVAGHAVRRRVRRDYRSRGRLRPTTAALAHGAYVAHAGATALSLRVHDLPLPREPAKAAGLAIAAAGIALHGAGRLALPRPETYGVRASVLATRGAYRLSRNPQLVGWGLLLLGLSVTARSSAGLVLTTAYAALVPATVADEERALRAAHGEAYRRYRQAKPRFL